MGQHEPAVLGGPASTLQCDISYQKSWHGPVVPVSVCLSVRSGAISLLSSPLVQMSTDRLEPWLLTGRRCVCVYVWRQDKTHELKLNGSDGY